MDLITCVDKRRAESVEVEWSIISSACDREWFWEWGLINTNIWYDTHECLWVRLEICVKPKVSRSYLNENRFWSVNSNSQNGVWLLGEQSGIKWRSIPRMELISLYWSIYRRMLVRQCSWVILKSTHVHPSRQKFNIDTHSGNNILGCMSEGSFLPEATEQATRENRRWFSHELCC